MNDLRVPDIAYDMQRVLSELRREIDQHAALDDVVSVVVTTHLDDLDTMTARLPRAPRNARRPLDEASMAEIDSYVSEVQAAVDTHLEEEQQNLDDDTKALFLRLSFSVDYLHDLLTRPQVIQ
jgi:hypothetical protein